MDEHDPTTTCITLGAAFALALMMLASAVTLAGQSNKHRPWMNRSLPAAQRADLLLRAMTLDDKIALVHGVARPQSEGYAGYVPPNPRLGIPALKLADGRAGVGNGAKGVTLLPAPIAAAASWDPALMNRFGHVLGEEEWGKGTNVALGPTIDVVRVPEWGRAFETYGEDPFLNSRMAAVEIKGIQSAGPIADANMYLTMSQETNRFHQDNIVDERTLQEIYLPPFRAAVQIGQVGTFMCAYVKTNGVSSCENPQVLTDFLRKQLKFEGWVMTDWGAAHSTAASAEAGLDQEMPTGKYYGEPLKSAVENGQVSAASLNEHVRRILVTMFRFGLFDKQQPGDWNANVRSAAHDAFSREAAEQGTVLLKNAHHLLPLSGISSIAVIGIDGGAKPQAEGRGSSHVIPPYVVTPFDGIRKRAGQSVRVSYTDGSNLTQAAAAARKAEIAIVFANTKESEGADRPNLELPGGQDQLISSVAAANPKTIIVLNTGGPVLMPWISKAGAVIEAWYPGQEDGNAIAAILFGDVDPSGKLPLTFPASAAEIPTSGREQWPGIGGKSVYSEKLDVGYRWYDAHDVQPLFPFGFGLSYTTFTFRDLRVSPSLLNATGSRISREVAVQVTVKNTGRRSGAEVVQAYVGQPARNGEPPRQLRGFLKVFLQAGESRSVNLTLDPHSFSVFDTASRGWVTRSGVYRIFVGDSSRNLPLHADVTVGVVP